MDDSAPHDFGHAARWFFRFVAAPFRHLFRASLADYSYTTVCNRRGLPTMIESISSTEAPSDFSHGIMLSWTCE